MKRSLISLALFPLLLAACTGTSGGSASLSTTHVHGLAVDRADSSRVYIATHHGLLAWQEGQGLIQVGRSRDDFMGFSVHPTDPQTLFRSGHPSGGGNLGFQKSTDTGDEWNKVSNGSPTGPADFHTMTVHPANPEHIYGWFGGRVHRSLDGGENWTVIPDPMNITSIAGDPMSDTTIYAGTPSGLLMSNDQGNTWSAADASLQGTTIIDIEPQPANGTLLLATAERGILRFGFAPEGGRTVEEVGILPGEDVAMHLAIDLQNPQILYAFSRGHALYKSTDGGQNWQKLL